MDTIRLSLGDWQYDRAHPLGPGGGFGEVFEGGDSQGRVLAVKRFYTHAEADAKREIDIAASLIGHAHRHVIPIYDCGRDAGSGRLFIVMPRASRSLTDFLKACTPDRAVALEILDSIAAGVEELGSIVSRDLKPPNVLEHEGSWKIADFGLSRIVGATTTPHTMRGGMTCAYAAPELWLMKRPTKAADMYALGCIAYELIGGKRPFPGPDESDYRDQHLNQAPPDLNTDPRILQVVRMCLSKAPEARPSADRFRKALRRVAGGGTPATPSPLAQAGAAVAAADAQKQAISAQTTDVKQTQAQLATEAERQFADLIGALTDAIKGEAPVARCKADRIELGRGALKWGIPFRIVDVGAFAETGWAMAFGGYVQIVQPGHSYPGRSANLWYAKAPGQHEYRWWEIQYMRHPLLGSHSTAAEEPFAFMSNSDLQFAANCLGKAMGTYQLAAKPRIVDDEYFDEFVNRWGARLAAAAEHKLEYPRMLPEGD